MARLQDGGDDRGVDRRPAPRLAATADESVVTRFLRQPRILAPLIVVVVMVALALLVQPGGESKKSAAAEAPELNPGEVETATATPTSEASPTAEASASAAAIDEPSEEVAGARTALADGSEEAEDEGPDLSRQSTDCGGIQETSVALQVEQSLQGISVRATGAAVYPIAYFRCILLATGGRDAVTLSLAVQEAERAGATHAALIDLWVANGTRDFGQVNLKKAAIAAAGQTFAPLATLGGRGEVVVASGEGRAVSIVVAVSNSVGETTGPMTLTLDAPLVGGKETQGKYQLFLPTP
jgi:hypothetical protein